MPRGVAAGTWDYVNERSIADHYDAFVADTPLCDLDQKIIAEQFPAREESFVPRGLFIVHVHHRWAALRESGGLRKLAKSWWQSWRDSEHDFGDSFYAYRGLDQMFIIASRGANGYSC